MERKELSLLNSVHPNRTLNGTQKPHTLNRGKSRLTNRFAYVTHLPSIRKYTNIFLRICQVLKVKIVIIC